MSLVDVLSTSGPTRCGPESSPERAFRRDGAGRSLDCMADAPRHPDTSDDAGAAPDRDSTGGTPWGMYVVAFLAIAFVVMFVALHVTGVLGPGAH